MNDLERRIQRLEDIEDIRRLKALYSKYADDKYTDSHERKPEAELEELARRQASLFTEDAVWDGGAHFGVHQGREAIYRYVRKGGWTFSMHYFVNPIIEVNGDHAQATWMLWQTSTLTEGEVPVFMAAVEDDEYVRTPEGWRMSRMTFTLKFMTQFDVPWSDVRNMPFSLQQSTKASPSRA